MKNILLFILTLSTFSLRSNAQQKTPTLTLLWQTPQTLTTSESVIYDAKQKVFYVSCINGTPVGAKDGDGFIAMLAEDGQILEHKWITGLDAPKGMAIVGNELYVTDIDQVVVIAIPTATIVRKIPVAGATFLNDAGSSKSGEVFVTDSDHNTLYKITDGKAVKVLEDAALGRLNGVFIDKKGMLLVGSSSGDAMRYTDGKLSKFSSGLGRTDGIEAYKKGYFASSWSGALFYIDPAGNSTKIIDTEKDKLNTADIEVVSAKKMLLVPTFSGNSVLAYRIN